MPQLPAWLEQLRNVEITQRVMNDPRSGPEQYLGVNSSVATQVVAGWGQANFDEPWDYLTPDDRVLLYAYFFQLGHLEELIKAFGMIFAKSRPSDAPIVVDLGCGPFTGGLAFSGALGIGEQFDYIGVDRSDAMRKLGEQLATAATNFDTGLQISRHWASDISSIFWNQRPAWRPIFVIISYLFASPTLNVVELVTKLEHLLIKLGRGPVTVLYTNSARQEANERFPEFYTSLCNLGFKVLNDDIGTIMVERKHGTHERQLKYALFYRPSLNTLPLGDN